MAALHSGPWQRSKRDYGIERDCGFMPQWPTSGDPEVAAEYAGMSVVLKPRGWEVDGKGSAPNDCELLSRFVQTRYPEALYPLVYTAEFDHGFIHRLDIPSSGLILTGTSFEGLYWIRWQLNVYYIAREYYVMCQDLALSQLVLVDLPIDVRTHKLGSHRSITSEHGGPALTWICVTAHIRTLGGGTPRPVPNVPMTLAGKSPPARGITLVDASASHTRDSVTPVCIRIRTGRKHQIRTHLRSSGHPSVADGMYTIFDVHMGRLADYEIGYLFAGCPD